MNELARRALIRALAAFAAILVFGTGIVWSVDVLRGLGTTEASAGPSIEPTASPGGDRPQAWLAWVPGGLPRGFGDAVAKVPAVRNSTTATADIAWLARSIGADGSVVDKPADPYRVPIDVTGVDPTFADFLPLPERTLVADLGPGEGILSETGAALRGLSTGSTLVFEGDVSIHVAGTLPDVLMGGYELLVTRDAGQSIGVAHERYLLFAIDENAYPDAKSIANAFKPVLPKSARYPVVEVRAPSEARYLRANDREMAPMFLKRRFGEFAAAVDAATGKIEVDPAWVGAHIESASLAVIGTVTCHTKALSRLGAAMDRIEREGTQGLIEDLGACYDPSIDPDDPGGALTARDFGAAIDLNLGANPPGDRVTQGSQPNALVKLMAKFGFGWGGADAWPQGALFRYQRDAKPAG